MSDETDIDILPPEESHSEVSEGTIKPPKRFGLVALLGVAFLSSAFGSSIIWVFSQFKKVPTPDLTPLQTQIEAVNSEAQALAAENKTLKAQLTRLQRDIKSRSNSPSIDLAPLEARLKKLEQAAPEAIDSDLVARLEALQDNGSEALDLSDILERLDTLENRPVPIAVTRVATSMPTLEMSFPSEAVLAVLEKPEGWLKKSLKKHISVQSDDNPQYLVELINKNIEVGDLEAALAAFDKLPAEAKAAAQDWRDSVERNE